jgi:putative transposase
MGARRSRAIKPSPVGKHAGPAAQSPAVHSAKVMDYEGIKTLLGGADRAFPRRLRHLWLEVGKRGEGKGADWVQKTLGSGAWSWWSVRSSPPPKRCSDGLGQGVWAKEGGVRVEWEKFMPARGFQVLPRRWVVERTIAWIDHNRRMSLGTTSVYRRAQKPSSTWR